MTVDPGYGPPQTVPLLESVFVPEATGTCGNSTAPVETWTMAYGGSGIITSLTLPTGGTLEWDYQAFSYINPGPSYLQSVTAVHHKRLKDTDGYLLGEWTYTQIPDLSRPEVHQVAVTDPLGNDTVHFFNVVGEFETGWDHGLPFSQLDPEPGSNNQRYLSREIFEGSYDSGTIARSVYVRYTADAGADLTSGNKRLTEERTYFDDDPSGTYVDTALTGFDGLGHYRTTTRTGGSPFPGERSVATAYNPERNSYEVDLLAGTGPTGNFNMLPDSEPWVLHTFSQRLTEEGPQVSGEEDCFDSRGFLRARRVLVLNQDPQSALQRDNTDLIQVFVRNANGNLLKERYAGGDVTPQAGTDLCALAGSIGPTAAEFGFNHTWQYGVLNTTHYATNAGQGADYSFPILDTTIDASTGLVASSRDTSGVETTYTYDRLGRPTSISPDGASVTSISYTVASGATPATRARIHTKRLPKSGSGTTLAESMQRFDGLGRLVREETLLPNSNWSIQETTYNARGWRSSVSERHNTNLSKRTQFLDYDPFGRPRTIRPADGTAHDITFQYQGVNRLTRTAFIAIGTAACPEMTTECGETTTEYYDYLGRLSGVVEAGDNGTVAEYSYDVGGHLSNVTLKTSDPLVTQNRTFLYDRRGFLLSETHPEKGPSGNGAVLHSEYDSRGHARRTIDGDHDLTFTYDRAERLVQVEETDDKLLKSFTYYGDNTAGDSRGKLESATRHNHFDLALGEQVDVTVLEHYTYEDSAAGRVSQRDTTVMLPGQSLEWTQGFHYTDLNNVSKLDYPCLSQGGACDTTSDPAAPREQTFVYTKGWLTSVPGFAYSIEYNPNGTVLAIHYNNGLHTWYGLDQNYMRRPRYYYAGSSSVEPATTERDEIAYDGAGNVKSIGATIYTYDEISRILDAEVANGPDQAYGYDAFGNLTSILDTPGGLRTIPVSPSTNRFQPGMGYVYDASGNLKETPQGLTFTYDSLNMMTSSDAEGALFVYTGDDERIGLLRHSAPNPSETWRLRGLDGLVLREYERNLEVFSDDFETGNLACWSAVDGGTGGGSCPTSALEEWTWIRDYVHRDGQLLATDSQDEGKLHYHVDHLGSTRKISNSASPPSIEENRLLPFGESLDPLTFSKDVPLRFTGHERDGGSTVPTVDDLDYMHARYYWPLMGRFLSPDAEDPADMVQPQSWNRYSYSLNNPLTLSDPNGRAPSDPTKLPTTPVEAFMNIMHHFEQVFRSGYMMSSEESKKLDKTIRTITGSAIATAAVIGTFQNIWDASQEEKPGKPRRQTGGREEAQRQYEGAVEPGSVTEREDGTRIGRDKETGRTLIYREKSTDPKAEATIEEQRVTESGRTRSREVRFDPEETGAGGGA